MIAPPALRTASERLRRRPDRSERHPAPDSGAAGSARPAAGPDRLRRIVTSAWLPVLVTIAPLLIGAARIVLRGGDHSPFGDGAYLELHVRDVGVHPVLLGPFSRYGWSHPGPALYELLAPFYRLSGGASRSLTVATLLINAAAVAGIALVVRRLLGRGAMLWSLVVCAVYLQVLGADVLQDSWNPHLPVLPFALAVLLSWLVARGRAWPLPGLVALDTLAVQSHIGFLLPVGLVTVATAVLLALRLVTRRRSPAAGPAEDELPIARARTWVAAGGVAVAVLALLWLPPVLEQLTHSPGNLRVLARYFRTAAPDGTLHGGLTWLGADVGALPARLVGSAPSGEIAAAPTLPVGFAVLGALVFVAGVVVAVRRRLPAVLALQVFAVAVGLAGVLAVQRIVGPAYGYLARWVVVAGLLVWLSAGLALVARRRTGAVAGSLAVLVLAALAVPATVQQARSTTPWTSTDGVIPSLNRQVLDWLGPDRSAVVRLDLGSGGPENFLALTNPMGALTLRLTKSGVPVRFAPFWRAAYGDRFVADPGAATRRLVLVFADGRSAPPEPGQEVVARAGPYAVYGSRLEPTASG